MRLLCHAIGVLMLFGCAGVQRADGGSGLLPKGSPVPELWAEDQNGEPVELVAPLERWTVLYFYPMDDTPGCTKEACAFRDAWDAYRQADVQVIGVSSDDLESHRAFAAKHELPFSLVADTDGRWAEAFGVPSLLGKHHRVTFLLDPEGKVAHVYDDVDPGVHAQQVLRDIEALGSEAGLGEDVDVGSRQR
jgi:peroxiredoxin Q/BCP